MNREATILFLSGKSTTITIKLLRTLVGDCILLSGLYKTLSQYYYPPVTTMFFFVAYLFSLSDQSLAAMKVLVADLTTDTSGVDELGCLQILAATNIHSPGYRHISHLLDHFTHQGPNGTHICLVLEPLGLSCLDVYRALPIMPFSLIKRICKHVLLSLQYMHDECSLVHTGRFPPQNARCFHRLTVSRHQGGQYPYVLHFGGRDIHGRAERHHFQAFGLWIQRVFPLLSVWKAYLTMIS